MISAVQVIAVVFALFAWSRVLIRFKDHQIKMSSLFLWSIVWVGLIAAALLPETPRILAKIVGVQRPVDALIYGSIIILLYMTFRLYVKSENDNQEITRIVRALAIERARKRH
jgi:hypothetical protein